jgi:hypothetical protein
MDLARWQIATDWPLMLAAIVFLVTYSWEVIADLHGPAETTAEVIIWATWAIFSPRLRSQSGLGSRAMALVSIPHP